MIRLIRSPRARVAAVSVLLVACGGRDPVSVRPAHIEILAGTASVHVGETMRLRARVTTSDGRPLTGRSVSWESLDPAIATVDQNGDLRGVGIGVATIRATSDPASNTAEITVSPGPSIQLSATQLELTAAGNSTATEQHTVEVTNGGGGTLGSLGVGVTYDDAASGDWLSATLSGSDAPAQVVLSADPGSLTTGTYEAILHVSSPHADNSPAALGVRFVVTEARPVIGLADDRVSFSAPQGSVDPAPVSIDVTNAGGGTLSGLTTSIAYGDRQPTGWLAATLDDTAPGTLTLQPTLGSLVAGVYTATVSVASPLAQNSPQAVTVTFSVGAPVARIELDLDSLTFSAVRGGADPALQHVQITNGGSVALTGLSTSVTYHEDEEGWLGRAVNSASAPATLTVGVNIDSLDVGTYTATLDVASTVAVNSPQPLHVTLHIEEPPPTVGLSASAIFMAALVGATPDAAQVTVTNSGGGTLAGLTTSITFTAGQTGGWLTATLSGTAAPAVVTLNASTDGLALGTYTARLRVTAEGGSAAEVGVTFTVAEPPPTSPTSLTATAVSQSQVNVAWSGATGNVTQYRLERKIGTSAFEQIGVFTSGTGGFSNANLTAATTYTYRVRACNSGGCSDYSPEASATTLAAP